MADIEKVKRVNAMISESVAAAMQEVEVGEGVLLTVKGKPILTILASEAYNNDVRLIITIHAKVSEYNGTPRHSLIDVNFGDFSCKSKYHPEIYYYKVKTTEEAIGSYIEDMQKEGIEVKPEEVEVMYEVEEY